MAQVFIRDSFTLCLQMLNGGLHVNRVPNSNRIGNQVEAISLIEMLLRILPANTSAIGRVQMPTQDVHFLAFVQLAADAAAIGFILEITQDENGFDQTSIFLQGTGQDMLARESLELANQP